MHCDEARATLFDRLEGAAAPAAAAQLDAHLETCDDCRQLGGEIQAMQAQARVWHELSPPPWNPDPGFSAAPSRRRGSGWLDAVQRWFPVLASAAALLLVAAVHWQERQAQQPAAASTAAPLEPAALPAAEQLLAASRQERQREMEALAALLKAEMDRRHLDTEESLKYIISHQIQSQRQIEAMRGQLQQAVANPAEQL